MPMEPTTRLRLVLANIELRRRSASRCSAYPALRLGRIPALPPKRYPAAHTKSAQSGAVFCQTKVYVFIPCRRVCFVPIKANYYSANN